MLLEPQSEEDTNLKYKYTGQERDYSTGLDYMHFRFYASSMGRFLKPDNLIPDITNPQNWNAYTYVKGNPVNFNDPSGHEPPDKEQQISQSVDGSNMIYSGTTACDENQERQRKIILILVATDTNKKGNEVLLGAGKFREQELKEQDPNATIVNKQVSSFEEVKSVVEETKKQGKISEIDIIAHSVEVSGEKIMAIKSEYREDENHRQHVNSKEGLKAVKIAEIAEKANLNSGDKILLVGCNTGVCLSQSDSLAGEVQRSPNLPKGVEVIGTKDRTLFYRKGPQYWIIGNE
ncbi:MAG: RHS repeat-associated core domain-containing protein [Thermoanaerobaculaceae bacterium]|nr:RHS repeat-associated core domain-containing protein [Thermoanaerobaculaceae bacterium]